MLCWIIPENIILVSVWLPWQVPRLRIAWDQVIAGLGLCRSFILVKIVTPCYTNFGFLVGPWWDSEIERKEKKSWYVPYSSFMVLQTFIFKILNHKIISIGVVFSNLFSLCTLAWTCMLHLRLQLLLVSFISQSLLNRFQYNLYYYLPYACSTSTAIFRLILSLKVTPESLLYSRVKHSVTHMSVVFVYQILRQDYYIDIKYDFTFLCKTIILVMSYVEFFKVWL